MRMVNMKNFSTNLKAKLMFHLYCYAVFDWLAAARVIWCAVCFKIMIILMSRFCYEPTQKSTLHL